MALSRRKSRSGAAPPIDRGRAVGTIEVLLVRHELADALEEDVGAPVGKLDLANHPPRAADGVDVTRRPATALFTAEEDHADQIIRFRDLLHHQTISWLEDVQRQEHLWKEHDVRQRKERDVAW